MSEDTNYVELATELTIAWLGNANNRVNADDVPAFITKMHDVIQKLGGGNAVVAAEAEAKEYVPAVSLRKSLASPDHIVSMIDGKSYKTLKRHLSTNGMTPAEYRSRYNLKADYPMVAPTYGEARRQMAKKIGLGRKPKAVEADAPAAKGPKKLSAKFDAQGAAKEHLGTAE